uniref:Epithelial cell transforming 2 n=1 Tax=Astyanax mexicanus TaxID=7994 RepID=A0A8B9H3I0_ASTMX
MADSSIVTLGMARSLLVDSSVYDSRMAETSKEHTFLGLAPDEAEEILRRVETRVVLVGETGHDPELVKALEDINVPCIKTDNVREFGDGENAEFETVFVLKDFQSPDYSYLYKNDNRILGPPVILHCAGKGEPLPFSSRPLYSTTMLNMSLCFTGFRKKEEVVNLVSLVHHMGGTIRKDFSAKVTHLIAHSTHGEKYRLAVCMGTPILTPDWIRKAWEHKDEINFHAGVEEFRTAFKVPPFQDCVLSFLGFSEEEKNNMEERTLKHGTDSSLNPFAAIEDLQRFFILFFVWFWGSIQMDARAGESMYSYEKKTLERHSVRQNGVLSFLSSFFFVCPVHLKICISKNLLILSPHTADHNPDKITLEKAIESLKEVMTHINEDKRKTEGQKQIFDVVYEVDGCPVSHLCVYSPEFLHIHLRKRHKVISTFKSPLGQTRPPAQLKHIMLMPLSQIRRVLDLRDTEECQNAFALVVRPPTEQENLLFSFQLTAEDTLKSAWLKTLCRQVANTICRADAEDLIQCTDPDSLQVSTKDMDSTLSRASRAIKKTSKKVTRAFSFTKTPKRVIQRAFMASSTPDDKSPGAGSDHMSRMTSSSTLAMSRSASTFSLSGCSKNAVVQRSNSLDNAPRPRVPMCVRTPCCPENASQPAPPETQPKVPTRAQEVPKVTLQPARPCRELLVPPDQHRAPGTPRRETLL